MILHAVYCDFLPNISEADKTSIFQKLQTFSGALDGVVSFEFGPNRDFEAKSKDYSDGFLIRFTNHTALERYATHATHQALGSILVSMCRNGADSIMVFDIEVAQSLPTA